MSYSLVAPNPLFSGQAAKSIPVGDSAPTYSHQYRGWQTSVGIIPDPDQTMVVAGASKAEANQSGAVVSRSRFKLLWKHEERIEIYDKLGVEDPVVRDFLRLLDDQQTTEIDMSITGVANGIRYIVSKLAAIKEDEKAARLAQILSGTFF